MSELSPVQKYSNDSLVPNEKLEVQPGVTTLQQLCADNLISIRHSFSPTGLKNYVVNKKANSNQPKKVNTARNPTLNKKEINMP